MRTIAAEYRINAETNVQSHGDGIMFPPSGAGLPEIFRFSNKWRYIVPNKVMMRLL